MVKASLIERTVSQKVAEHESVQFTETKPKSVWLKEGYEEAVVDRCPKSTCPLLGEVFSVPLKQDIVRDLHRSVTEKVLEKERALQEKKQGKKRKAEAELASDPEVVLEVPVPARVPTPSTCKGKGPGQGKPPGQGPAAAAKKAAVFNNKQKSLAAKAVSLLTAADNSGSVVQKQLAKLDLVPETRQALQDGSVKLADWAKAGTNVLKLLDGALPDSFTVPALPFDSKDLQDTLSTFNNFLKEARQAIKEHKQKLKDQKLEAEGQQAAAREKPARRVRGKGALGA